MACIVITAVQNMSEEDVPFWRPSHSAESHFLHSELLWFPGSRIYRNAPPHSRTAYQGCLFQRNPPWRESQSDPGNDTAHLPDRWLTWIWASLPGLSFAELQSGSTMVENSRASTATLLHVLGTRERYSGPCSDASLLRSWRGLKDEVIWDRARLLVCVQLGIPDQSSERLRKCPMCGSKLRNLTRMIVTNKEKVFYSSVLS